MKKNVAQMIANHILVPEKPVDHVGKNLKRAVEIAITAGSVNQCAGKNFAGKKALSDKRVILDKRLIIPKKGAIQRIEVDGKPCKCD